MTDSCVMGSLERTDLHVVTNVASGTLTSRRWPMPELPEVEAAAALARRVALQRTIARVRLHHAAHRRRLTVRAARSLAGDEVTAIERRGKSQVLHLKSGRRLIVHFRMTGDWVALNVGESLTRHARATIEFHNGQRLVLDDPRALSVLTLQSADVREPSALGPDALLRTFNTRWLQAALARRRVPIKQALLDQSVVAGVGNIYAAEALWHARIDPRRPANALDGRSLNQLVLAVRAVLRRALRRAERYVRTGDTPPSEGRFAVYDREGKPCPRCRKPIRRIAQGGRSTYFCPNCQR
jgi:formamidopyrimidine-DNA glycosylase